MLWYFCTTSRSRVLTYLDVVVFLLHSPEQGVCLRVLPLQLLLQLVDPCLQHLGVGRPRATLQYSE